MKFSFIIPVYNTGHLVEKCISSIISSGIEDYEIICINDGSSDNSWSILQRIKKKYDFLKIFTKSNGGLSDTRNLGMKLAQGEYLMFLDSDDWVDGKELKQLSNSCNSDLEIVHGNFVFSYNNGSTISNKSQIQMTGSGQEILIAALLQDKFSMPVCINFYKLSFLKKFSLEFKKGIYHEDEEFNLRAFSYAKKMISTNIYFYYYLQHTNSITNNDNNIQKRLQDIQLIYKELNIFLDSKLHITNNYRQMCKTYLSFVLILGYAKIKDKKIAFEFKKIIKSMKIYKNISSPIFMYRLSKLFLVISPDIFLNLFRYYFQFRNKKI